MRECNGLTATRAFLWQNRKIDLTAQIDTVTASSRSALFVDFDNVYLGLYKRDPDLARRFAEQPGRWIEWLQRALDVPRESWLARVRRILVRRCYLNPQSFGRWRAYFIRAGFETIDCPPLTAQGKTSADVHMVLDIVDFLGGPTIFDEFIIMSADADFAPVLLKLRKHDRRSIVLAIGPSSSAYMAASDLVIDQEMFFDFLLSEVSAAEPTPAASPLAEAPIPALPVVTEASSNLFAAKRDELTATVRDAIARNATAVPLATIAHLIRARHPDIASTWGGFDSFSEMLERLDLSDFTRVNKRGGYLYDPARHAPPVFEEEKPDSENVVQHVNGDAFSPLSRAAEDGQQEATAMRDLARRVSDLTDVPFLSPESYAELFSILALEINTNGYHMTKVSKAVRDECQKRGRHISRDHVNFVLQGIAYAGHRFGKTTEDEKELANIFLRNAVNLCVRNQLYLNDDEQHLLSKWLVGNVVSNVAQDDDHEQ